MRWTEEEQACRHELARRCAPDQNALALRYAARDTNQEFAEIHGKLLRHAAIGILKQLEGNGEQRFSDALRALENDDNAIYYVMLPNDFIGKDSKLLCPLINPMTRPQVNVTGLLLDLVIEEIKRTANGIKKRKSEIMTAEVIRRLERK